MDNQFLKLKLRREREREGQKDCDLEWIPRIDCAEDDHPTHKCKRKAPHRANHVCPCGATKKTKSPSLG